MDYVRIDEGGTPRIMTAKKLKINLDGGGTSTWVPENSVSTGTKSIAENGEYGAQEDNLYAYSSLTVNVPAYEGSGVSGIGSNGYTLYVSKNSSGVLTEKILPDKISLNVQGRTDGNTTYFKIGDTVNITGAKAWKVDGSGVENEWADEEYPDGIIPANELKNIQNDLIQDSLVEVIDGTFHNPVILAHDPITIESQRGIVSHYVREVTTYGLADFSFAFIGWQWVGTAKRNYIVVLYAGDEPFSVYEKITNEITGMVTENTYTAQEYTKQEKTVYWYMYKCEIEGLNRYSVNSTINQALVTGDQIALGPYNAKSEAWYYIYGYYTGTQLVQASWNRPLDDKELLGDNIVQVRIDHPNRYKIDGV